MSFLKIFKNKMGIVMSVFNYKCLQNLQLASFTGNGSIKQSVLYVPSDKKTIVSM